MTKIYFIHLDMHLTYIFFHVGYDLKNCFLIFTPK